MADPGPIDLEARLRVSDGELTGELRGPDGRRTEFSGWLGLIGAVEAACEPDPAAEAEGSE